MQTLGARYVDRCVPWLASAQAPKSAWPWPPTSPRRCRRSPRPSSRTPATRRSWPSAPRASSTPRSGTARPSRCCCRPTTKRRRAWNARGWAWRAPASPTPSAGWCSGAGSPALVDDKGDVLRSGRFERLALADPKLAPYGAAAVEVLTGLGLDVCAGAEVRAGREHRPDLPVRRHRQRRTRLRRLVPGVCRRQAHAGLGLDGAGDACTHRSARTRWC